MRTNLAKRLDNIQRQLYSASIKHIEWLGDKSYSYNAEDAARPKIYIPSKTGLNAHRDDSFVRLMIGPYGSGKTTWAIQEIIKRTCEMPAWDNGKRSARWCIVRNTSGELQSTTLNSWMYWFGDLGDVHKRQKPILELFHRFNDGKGIIELDVLFLALDRPDDIRKLKSLELTGCYINEMCEVPQEVLKHMQGRVNRYPAMQACPNGYWSGIIADTNPPDEDHWIVKDFEQTDNPKYALYKQPPGLYKGEDGLWHTNPDAENIEHLKKGYYEDLATGNSKEFIKVFCLGQYGTVGTGKVVFPDFNSDLHAVDYLEAIQGQDIYLGWDFGLTPACVVVQLTTHGQLLVLKEYCCEDMGIKSFAESVVIPALKTDFPYCKIGDSIADPAGHQRSQVMEEMTCIGELCQLGINTIAARTNDIEPRLASVRYFLNKLTLGKPAFVIDKKKCPTLYKGFVKDYYYERLKVTGEERYRDRPSKNKSSHPHDALGYVCLELASERITEAKEGQKRYEPIDNQVMNLF